MAQPEYVPVVSRDRVRVSERLPTPDGWIPDRPAELRGSGAQPAGPLLGSAGPDQGYALSLFRRLDLVLGVVAVEDARAGGIPVALKRAAAFGRAPILADLEVAFTLWGFFPGAPPDLIAFRDPLFVGVAHDYARQRGLADRVPVSSLQVKPASLDSWRSLITV